MTAAVDESTSEEALALTQRAARCADVHQGGELPAHDADPVHAGRGPEGGRHAGCAGQQHEEAGGAQGAPVWFILLHPMLFGLHTVDRTSGRVAEKLGE